MKSLIEIYKKYWNIISPHPIYFSLILISKIFALFMTVLMPIAAANVIKYITLKDLHATFQWVSYFGVFSLGRVLFYYWNYVAGAEEQNDSYHRLKKKVLSLLQKFDLDFSKKIPIERVNQTLSSDILNVVKINDHLSDLVITILKMLFVSIYVLKIHILMGFMICGIYLFYLFILDYFNKRTIQALECQVIAQDRVADQLTEIIEGADEIKVYHMEKKLHQDFNKCLSSFQVHYKRRRKWHDFQNTIVSLLVHFGKIFLLSLMLYELFQGRFSVDKIVLILGYYDQLKSDMDYIALTCLSNIRECGVSVHRLFELFHYHSKDMIPFGDINKPVVEGALTFSHVQSSYGEKKVLHDLSFQIQPGEITAIVGKSGSGKTTILNAILRLYKIDSGRILLDNKSIYDYQELAFLQSVSVVTQKSFIFNFTIRENLSLVERHYEKQEEVCKMLGIHERILALPAGYDTKIEENGRYLSREVSQMISIARSILTGAKVLLFDEITSSLDQVNTRRAMEIFHQLKKDHTVIIITHKPEVMKVADHLLLLDQGRIVGDGSPSDLEQNPYYKKLQNLDRADSSEN